MYGDKLNLFNLQRYLPIEHSIRCTRSFSQIKRNLLQTYEEPFYFGNQGDGKRARRHQRSLTPGNNSKANQLSKPQRSSSRVICKRGKQKSDTIETLESNETSVQCDSYNKWWKNPSRVVSLDDNLASFFSINMDAQHQRCSSRRELGYKQVDNILVYFL